jgi:hypothetical protein
MRFYFVYRKTFAGGNKQAIASILKNTGVSNFSSHKLSISSRDALLAGNLTYATKFTNTKVATVSDTCFEIHITNKLHAKKLLTRNNLITLKDCKLFVGDVGFANITALRNSELGLSLKDEIDDYTSQASTSLWTQFKGRLYPSKDVICHRSVLYNYGANQENDLVGFGDDTVVSRAVCKSTVIAHTLNGDLLSNMHDVTKINFSSNFRNFLNNVEAFPWPIKFCDQSSSFPRNLVIFNDQVKNTFITNKGKPINVDKLLGDNDPEQFSNIAQLMDFRAYIALSAYSTKQNFSADLANTCVLDASGDTLAYYEIIANLRFSKFTHSSIGLEAAKLLLALYLPVLLCNLSYF